MTKDKGSAVGALLTSRYEVDLKLVSGLKTVKTTDKEKVIAERAAVQTAYLGMGELQALITEA